MAQFERNGIKVDGCDDCCESVVDGGWYQCNDCSTLFCRHTRHRAHPREGKLMNKLLSDEGISADKANATGVFVGTGNKSDAQAETEFEITTAGYSLYMDPVSVDPADVEIDAAPAKSTEDAYRKLGLLLVRKGVNLTEVKEP